MIFVSGFTRGTRNALGTWAEALAKPSAPAPAMGFVAFRGRLGFEQLLPPWRELGARSGGLRFMQDPDWYRALFESGLMDPDDFLFAATYSGPDLVGLCPLQLGRQRLMGLAVARRLGLCNHPHMALADIVVDDPAAHRGLIGELVDWLETVRPVEWDMLALERVPDRSAIRHSLAAGPASAAIAGYSGASAYIRSDSDVAALSAVSRSFRHNLRRLSRRAETSAPLRMDICLSPETLAPALADFLALEASGWKGAGGRGSAIAEHPRLVAFYRLLTQRFGQRGQCAILLLYHGDRLVAAQYGLLAGGGYNILKIAYSESAAAFAPGNLLMERAIMWCCERPDIDELSFVTSPDWSGKWKPLHDPVRTYRLFASTLRGRLLQGALRARQWSKDA